MLSPSTAATSLAFFLLLLLTTPCTPFAPPTVPFPLALEQQSNANSPQPRKTTSLWSLEPDPKAKPTKLPEGVRNSLLAESIAPWRNLRLFFYFSASSSAFLGLLITLANISAPEGMRTTAPSEVDNLTANVGVNLLGVIGGAVAGYFDWKKGEELKSNVEAKRARVKSGRAADKKAQDKWDAVMSTPLALNSGEAKTLKELTSQRLSPVFLRGTRAYVGEQMLGAKLQKEVVKRSGMVVVPLPEGGEPRRGFGEDTMPEYAADGAEAREVVELMDGELRVAKEQVRGKPD